MLKLYNTLTRKKETFKPLKDNLAKIYTCGPTVYNYAHIGNLRTYIFEDILKRVLFYNKYKVKHVMNITDVGHLTSEADTGEDKLEKGAKREGKTAWEIAEVYTKTFKEDIKKLNIIYPNIWCKATNHIKEQIDLIKSLEKRGFTYKIEDGIYFNTSKLKDYGKLARLNKEKLKAGARIDIKDKKIPTDFALWKFSPKNKKRDMEWKSPWGKGFPGWHIECSAMSLKYLGNCFDPFGKLKVDGEQCRTIDIHTGGEDHLSVHHPNEIAQSEAATGKKPFVNYWIHHAFLKVDGKKMSKSLGNFYTIEDVQQKGYEPLSLRYLFLTTHYRSPLNFTWEALSSAQKALEKLRQHILSVKEGGRKSLSAKKQEKADLFRQEFIEAVNDDLNTAKALAFLWQVLKSNIPSTDKYDLALYFDEVLGLGLDNISKSQIPNEIQSMADKREEVRKKGKFKEADKIRQKIEARGFSLEDTPKGVRIKRNAKPALKT